MKALITTLMIALPATAAKAAEPKPYGIDITNKDSVGASVWITVYNFVGDIGDNACLPPGPRLHRSCRGETKPRLFWRHLQ